MSFSMLFLCLLLCFYNFTFTALFLQLYIYCTFNTSAPAGGENLNVFVDKLMFVRILLRLIKTIVPKLSCNSRPAGKPLDMPTPIRL
jgi:hypothetical protein